MSSYDQPVITEDGVQWNLEKGTGLQRFYYNCKVKNDSLKLPWTFDVSYKLNGVPCKAETLAGASGLVEINVSAIPNPEADTYYKNNMLLMVTALINTEDVYSIDAPGSQLQSVGTYKAVLFTALPGEKATFTMRIGTDCFETQGITMMMVPGTIEQLKRIKELKEAKDTLQGSSEAIYYSMSELLLTMESMREGLTQLQNGLLGLEDARSTFSAGRDQLSVYADLALNNMTAVNEQLKNMIPYFQTARDMTEELNNEITNLTEDLKDLKEPLNDIKDSISTARSNLVSLSIMLNTLGSQIGSALTSLGNAAADPIMGASGYEIKQLQGRAAMAATLNKYMDSIESLLIQMRLIGDSTKEIIEVTNTLIKDTNNLSDTLNDYQDDLIALLNDCEKLTILLNSSIDSTVTFLSYSKALLQESIDKLDAAAETSLNGMTDILDKSLLGMDSIETMRHAIDTVKRTLDNEFSKFEDENQFLNLDAEAKLVSFTSAQNPSPESIQVILRTEEISLDKGQDELADLETEKAELGFVDRIKKLIYRILQIFQ